MSSPKPTLQQRLCETFEVPATDFTRTVLRKTLPLHAKLLLPFVRVFEPDLLAADYDLINDIAHLTRRRDFLDYVSFHHFHPAHRGALRKVFRVRVSVSRLQRLVHKVMVPTTGTPPPEPRGPC